MHIWQVDIGGKIELQPPPKRSSSRALIVLLALVGLLLVLSSVAVAFFVINPHSGRVTLSTATATSVAHATGTAGIPATAIVGVTNGTPGQPTHVPGTGTPHTSATATTPPSPPVLEVTPQSITKTLCAGGQLTQATFTIQNGGGDTLKWTASSSNTKYSITPSQGVVAPGDSPQSVTVSNIFQSGTVTVSATDVNGNPLPSSPQTVTVKCTA